MTHATLALHTHKKSTNVRPPLNLLAAFGVARAFSWAPSVSARAANYLWTHPRRRVRPEREASVLAQGESIRIPIGMGSLAGWRWGAGPTVLLVHGWEGRGSQLGAFVQPLVEAGYSVLSFDAPAHGDSEGERASLIRFADAIDATLRVAGPVHGIVAHSMGGAATLLALASARPVERVVLIAPADPALALGRFSRSVGLAEPVQQRLAEDMESRYGARMDTYSAQALARGASPPTLVIHDHDDRWVPIDDAHSFIEGRPDIELVATHGLGHHRILREPQVIESALRYLDGRGPGVIQSAPREEVIEWHITHDEVMADLNYGR